MQPYTVSAFNTALSSENKIHDDATAARFGFAGGLVPGVEVFAYMAHVPVAAWGEAFLTRGAMRARFLKPVYDGDAATVTASEADGGLALTLSARGVPCAEGWAGFDDGPLPPLCPSADVPALSDVPKASADSLVPGRVLGTLHEFYMAEGARHYLADIREAHPLFAAAKIAHPGYLLRRANFVLAYTVRLGPWIHSESRVRLHSVLRDGEPFDTAAVVVENVERKGHRIAALDFTIGSRGRLVMSGRHWAIWEPRQVRGG